MKGRRPDQLPDIWGLNTIETMHMFHTLANVWRGGHDATRTQVQVPKIGKQLSNGCRWTTLEDYRVEVLDTIIKYQEETKTLRDKSVKTKEFDEGNLVLIRTPRTQAWGKLEPKWEGPYIVSKKTSPYTYRLTSQTGVHLDHSWSVENIQRFYV